MPQPKTWTHYELHPAFLRLCPLFALPGAAIHRLISGRFFETAIATMKLCMEIVENTLGRSVWAMGLAVFVGLGLLRAAEPATNPASGSKFPCPENEIAQYTAYRAAGPITIDGRLTEETWKKAPTSPRFIDILSGARTVHDTRATVVWDDTYLYLGYRIEEPMVQAKYTNRNDPIYYDNDVEFFIAGKDAYYEFEINAFNTTYEVFFIWEKSYETAGFARLPEFQRNRLQPFNGVGFTQHPRGRRLGNFNWFFPGKKTAVHIDGTVNKHDDRDRGWTVELAFPWEGLRLLADPATQSIPPKEGEIWRMDFSRFNTYKAAAPDQDSGGWVWTRHGIWDSHIPECFARIQFSTQVAGTGPESKKTPAKPTETK